MIKKYQDKLISEFKKINDEFNKKKIFWFAHSGTLLGIIRHNNSFIPWDDDIDMAMPYYQYILYKNEISNIFQKYDWKVNDRIELEEDMLVQFTKEIIFDEKKWRMNIDLMLGISENCFKNNYELWKWRWIKTKILARFIQNKQKQKYSLFWSILFSEKKLWEEYKYILNKNIYDGRMIKFDFWMHRKYLYNGWTDKSGFIETQFENNKIWINKDFENELKNWYGKKWKKEKKPKYSQHAKIKVS